MESPSLSGRKALGSGFTDIVEERRPAKPQIRRNLRDVVQDLEAVGKILLVAFSVHGLDAFEPGQFGEDVLQQAYLVQEAESHRGNRAQQNLVQFFDDALLREDRKAGGHFPHGVHGFGDDVERVLGRGELRNKTHGPQHPERVVGIGLLGLERGPDHAFGEMPPKGSTSAPKSS